MSSHYRKNVMVEQGVIFASFLIATLFLLLASNPQWSISGHQWLKSASASTNVSGAIFSDTTWTVAGGPYVVTDNILATGS